MFVMYMDIGIGMRLSMFLLNSYFLYVFLPRNVSKAAFIVIMNTRTPLRTICLKKYCKLLLSAQES